MRRIRLINPNTSSATTAMMVGIARSELPDGWTVEGVTAHEGPPMIVDDAELADAVPGVIEMGSAPGPVDGIIVAAYGDPGLEELRAGVDVPVTGIFEASALEASAGGRRFAIATVTPGLERSLRDRVARMGLSGQFAGIRLTEGEPRELAADPARLVEALARQTERAIREDGAEAVIIGGGPLGEAARELAGRFPVPVIAPIPAAVRLTLARVAAAG